MNGFDRAREIQVNGMKPGTNRALYPKQGTNMAGILECLAAEPATLLEITEYVEGSKLKSVSTMLDMMRRKKLVKGMERNRWALTSPETEALVYGGEA